MSSQTTTDIVGLFVFIAAFLFSNEVANVVGPYMVIAVAATVGASFSVARRDKDTRLGAVWFFAKLVILAVLVTVGLAALATAHYPALQERSLLAPIALLVGFVGEGWPALLGKVMKFLGGLLDLARGKGGIS